MLVQGLSQERQAFVFRGLAWLVKLGGRAKGLPLCLPEANLAELMLQAREFAEKRLPILKALLVV
ncbi:MAG: hypothetical protein WAZ34_10970 [Rhodocyclaceae bacterium]